MGDIFQLISILRLIWMWNIFTIEHIQNNTWNTTYAILYCVLACECYDSWKLLKMFRVMNLYIRISFNISQKYDEEIFRQLKIWMFIFINKFLQHHAVAVAVALQCLQLVHIFLSLCQRVYWIWNKMETMHTIPKEFHHRISFNQPISSVPCILESHTFRRWGQEKPEHEIAFSSNSYEIMFNALLNTN